VNKDFFNVKVNVNVNNNEYQCADVK